ncbi:MAG: ribonuclease HI family protein [Candidatus Omnitrophota bacterium]
MNLTLFIDGASRGNPGRAAIGVALYDGEGKAIKEAGLAIGITTNNVAEYVALLYGLTEALLWRVKSAPLFTTTGASSACSQQEGSIIIYSDSELVINQVTGRFQVKNEDIKRLHLLAKHLLSGFEKVSFEKLSHDENKTADSLANKALDNAS